MVSSFMDEFISFHGKRNEPKKSRRYIVGLRLLCALRFRPVAAELATLRQSSLFSGLSLQCSTTQKGMGRSKKSNIKASSYVIPAQAGIQSPKNWILAKVIQE